MAIDPTAAATSMFSGSISKIASYWWLILIVVIFGILGIIAFVGSKLKKNKATWNIKIRVRQENILHKNIDLDTYVINARRVTLNNGLKMNFLAKPLLGKRLMPLLNYYTKPGVYDILLTADNRIFILTGIEGVDKKRKILNVGYRYPGIDQDFDELNNEYAKLNEQDKKSSLLDFIKYASIGIFAVCALVAIIVGGNYLLEAKKADAAISITQLEVFESLEKASIRNLEFANAMSLLIPKLNEAYGTNNLRSQIMISPQTNQTS